MCHVLLQDPKFFTRLLRMDHDLAAQARVPAAARLDLALGRGFAVPRRTMERGRGWWREQFPLWRAAFARFMPPVATQQLPAGLIEREDR